jgi:hypothetical protein
VFHPVRILLITALYWFVMLLTSSLYNSVIMDPLQLLWAICLFIVGPILLICSSVILIRALWRRPIAPKKIAVTGFAIVTVLVWSFGFWKIGATLRPVFFRLIAGENERLALSVIQQNPPDTRLWMTGFRYPYFDLGTTLVYHHEGSVFIMIPSAPGEKDSLVYLPPGSQLSEDFEHLIGPWYYDNVMGH